MMTEASAPGKIILFGEHAVVYGRPAIAIPVSHIRAQAQVHDSQGNQVTVMLPDVERRYQARCDLSDWPGTLPPLLAAVQAVQRHLRLPTLPALAIHVVSAIPIASGLGSGAATAAALIRALLRHLGDPADDATVSNLTYEVEKLHHGSPSGIDNSVVAYERPVYFLRRQPHPRLETVAVAQPLHFLIGNTGVRSATREVVGDVRQQWQARPARFEALFNQCGRIARAAHLALAQGQTERLGRLMHDNHHVLQALTVSSPDLDRLVMAASTAGALGAKLSGGGRGGNMIALTTETNAPTVAAALYHAGATAVLSTTLAPGSV